MLSITYYESEEDDSAFTQGTPSSSEMLTVIAECLMAGCRIDPVNGERALKITNPYPGLNACPDWSSAIIEGWDEA